MIIPPARIGRIRGGQFFATGRNAISVLLVALGAWVSLQAAAVGQDPARMGARELTRAQELLPTKIPMSRF